MDEKMSIMIVDDEIIVRESFFHWFAKFGHKVDTAASGFEALEKLEKFPFEVLFVDIKMPGMDGIEALRVIRRDIRLQSTPVVMLTSVTDLNTVTEAIESGANDYIAKPFKIGKLMECVEKYVHAKTSGSLGKKSPSED